MFTLCPVSISRLFEDIVMGANGGVQKRTPIHKENADILFYTAIRLDWFYNKH